MRIRVRGIVAAFVSILFTICFFIGKVFDKQYDISSDKFFLLKAFIVLIVSCVSVYIIYMLFDRLFHNKIKKKRISQKIFDDKRGILAWIILMLAWLPNYILYLPGVFTVDGINQIDQLATGQLTNHHPILTTLIEAPWILAGKYFGHIEIGLMIYLLLTFVFTSYVIYRGFYWMSRHEISYGIRYLMLIYFSVYPIWSAYARTFVKDTLFYPIFYLYILCMFDILIQKEGFFKGKKRIIKFFIISILLCLVRHNGFYICAATIAGIFIFCKRNRKILAFLMMALIIFWKAYNAVLPMAGIVPGGKQEMLSIPFQQTARYVKEHGKEVTAKEKEAISKVLNYEVLAQNYDPNLSDPVKNTYTGQDEYLSDYFKIWSKQLLKHPDTYISATLNGTYGYYAYKDWIKCANGYYTQPVYFYKYDQYYKINDNKIFEKQRSAYYNNVIIGIFQDGPMKILTQPMLYHWAMILLLGYFLQDEKLRKYWIAFFPVIISFFICIASPVNGDLRYTLPVMSTTFLYFAFAKNIIDNK